MEERRMKATSARGKVCHARGRVYRKEEVTPWWVVLAPLLAWALGVAVTVGVAQMIAVDEAPAHGTSVEVLDLGWEGP